MPSTIGYASLGLMVDKSTRENNLVHEIATKLSSYSSHDHEHTAAQVAKFIYGNSVSLMNKHRLEPTTYYQCVAKALKRTKKISNVDEVVTELIKLIEDSAAPLRELVGRR